jgi:predicted nucleic acid-binding Zn ribbon protein
MKVYFLIFNIKYKSSFFTSIKKFDFYICDILEKLMMISNQFIRFALFSKPNKGIDRGSKIQPHTHCRVCGKSIPLNREVCSTQCAEQQQTTQKRAKRMNQIFMIFMIIIIVFFILSYILGSSV